MNKGFFRLCIVRLRICTSTYVLNIFLFIHYSNVCLVYGYIIYQQSRKTAPILSPVSGIKRKLSNLIKPSYRNSKKFGDNLFIWFKVFNIDGETFWGHYFWWYHYWRQRGNGYLYDENCCVKKLGQAKRPLTAMHSAALSLTHIAVRQVTQKQISGDFL